MPNSTLGNKFLVLGREYVSGWVEGRALKKNNSESIAKFIYEEFICR
jgi:hypothetical protein